MKDRRPLEESFGGTIGLEILGAAAILLAIGSVFLASFPATVFAIYFLTLTVAQAAISIIKAVRSATLSLRAELRDLRDEGMRLVSGPRAP